MNSMKRLIIRIYISQQLLLTTIHEGTADTAIIVSRLNQHV